MKHDPTVRHLLERVPAKPGAALIANSGPMSPPQRRAMWAKKNDPNQASASDRPYIPVPRVPIPGYPRNPPPHSGASESVEYGSKVDTEEPKETYYERIMRQIAEIRARGAIPPGAQFYTREDGLNEPGRSGKLPKAPPLPVAPYHGSTPPRAGTGSGIWRGTTPDPALKKKRYPWEGRINNRAGAALRFLEQLGGRP